MKHLAKETAIYGASSILGKFVNFLLVPLYTRVLMNTGEYGIVTHLYSLTALLMVVLTYGMETGFFRFANKYRNNYEKVYSTALIMLAFTSILFVAIYLTFSAQITTALGYGENPEFVTLLMIAVAMDAFSAIPFAYLRFKNRPIRFVTIKFVYIIGNVVLNLFFFVACPWLMKVAPQTVDWFYNPTYSVGYIFVSNAIATVIMMLFLIPEVFGVKFYFSKNILQKMLRYSFPLLILGVAGIMNQSIDRLIFPYLFEDEAFARSELGIYGACFKVAMIMMMFTQAFRYAYEPFVFSQHKSKTSKAAYADAMKYYVIFSLLIFLGMMFYLDLLKPFFLKETYWSGLKIIPIVLWAYIFQGIYFNLSIWYKLKDKTMFGALFAGIGLTITLTIQIIFVPKYSYMASAWAAFACFFVMMLVSYFVGKKYMPIKYDLKTIALYIIVTLVLFGASFLVDTKYAIVNYVYRTFLLALFIILMVRRDFPLSEIPIVKRFVKK
jgi:O-antigen/teichoic acid export membrane protein